MNKHDMYIQIKKRVREMTVISLPVVMEQVFITLMGVINTMMAAGIGEHAVSAVGMVDSVSNIIISFFAALTTGGTIVVAQYTGKKDFKSAGEAAAQAVVMTVLFASFVAVVVFMFKKQVITLLFGAADAIIVEAALKYMSVILISFPILGLMQTAFGIIRGAGDTSTPMKITMIINVISVVITYILINGFDFTVNIFGIASIPFFMPSLGVIGAAVGLLVARLCGAALATLHLLFRSKDVHLKGLFRFKFNLSMQKIILNIGVPTSVESVLFSAGKLITQIFIVGMGTYAIAANSIASSVAGLLNVPGSALCTGVMIIVGHRVGMGDVDDVKKTTVFSVVYSSALMGIVCLVCLPFTNAIISLFGASPQTSELAKAILYTFYISTPLLWSSSFVMPAALRATGDVRHTMVIAVASMWLFRIFTGYFLGIRLNLGIVGIWFGMYFDWLIRSILFTIRLVGNKWRGKSIR